MVRRIWLLFMALMVMTGMAMADKAFIRVQARDYWELYDRIPFKGSSIEIAGGIPGESYDLLVDRAEMGLVTASGLSWKMIDVPPLDPVDSAEYRSWEEHVALMRNWAASYPAICRLDSIGRTHEGNWIYGVKISGNVHVDDDRPEVLLEATHHAREWAAPEAARHFVDTLLTNYATNPEFREFIDNTQIWVFPVVNVDGYQYDYPRMRMWRENRQPFADTVGSDPNRSYNGVCDGNPMADWGALVRGSVSSHQPRTIIWMGANGTWAKEVNALAEFFKQRNFVANITLHSYSELVLWPYSDGRTAPDDEMLSSLGRRMAAEMPRLGRGTYIPSQSNELYPTSGGSIDWMYGWAHNVGGFPCMSYVFELGTRFYQPLRDLPAILTSNFRGAYYLFRRADSIRQTLSGRVPPPVLNGPDTIVTGNVTLQWSPVRPAFNRPDRWELEELIGLTVIEDDFESGADRWTLGGASISTAQKKSGEHSIYLGTGNNISNYALTTDPYPVRSGDSLRFWIWYQTERDYDVVVAEVSENGLEWHQLHDRFTGNSRGWQPQAFSLEPWVGSSVFIRLRYMTDDNTLDAGVYIDDVWPVPAFAERRVLSNTITDTLYDISELEPGSYWYRVRGRNTARGWNNHGPLKELVVTTSGIAGQPEPILNTGISAISPNPAIAGMTVNYTLAHGGNARVAVYDAAGREVRVLHEGLVRAGAHVVRWDGRDNAGRSVPAGVYYCRLTADRNITVRFTLLR